VAVKAGGLADGRRPRRTQTVRGHLGEQPGLVLVFLNGCCTEPQVRRLRAAGVKAVWRPRRGARS